MSAAVTSAPAHAFRRRRRQSSKLPPVPPSVKFGGVPPGDGWNPWCLLWFPPIVIAVQSVVKLLGG